MQLKILYNNIFHQQIPILAGTIIDLKVMFTNGSCQWLIIRVFFYSEDTSQLRQRILNALLKIMSETIFCFITVPYSISLHYTISGSTTHTFKVNSLPLEPYAFLLFNNFSCNRRFHFRTQPSHPFKRYLHAGENLLQDFLYTVFCGKINPTATFTHCRRVSSQLSNLVGK